MDVLATLDLAYLGVVRLVVGGGTVVVVAGVGAEVVNLLGP